MESKRYINLNGTFYQKDAPVLGSSNRAFLYGDALFESMHANGTTVQFFDLHYKRLIDSSKILHFELPEYFSFDFMKNEIRRLIQKNRSFKGSRIRLSLFRDSGGLFTPLTNRCSYLIEQSELPFSNYRLNTKGLVIDIFDRIRKPFNILSGLKSANSLLFVLAGIYKKENNFDDCLLMNERGNIIEATSSNIFLFRNNNLITPPLEDACLPGIMRTVILNIAKDEGTAVLEQSISIKDIEESDEVFLSNAISGIRWVLAFRSKRFYNQHAKLMIEKINRISGL